jgi:predicted phage terminase large subunit-like protein
MNRQSRSSPSVSTAWLHHKFYLIDVLRGRYDYPSLRARAIEHARIHRPERILIEDAGVGVALIAELSGGGLPAIAVKPERDKVTRMSVQSAQFECGSVYLPERAPWLADLEAELFAFPNSRYDDQVGSISQALAHEFSGYEWTDGAWQVGRRKPPFRAHVRRVTRRTVGFVVGTHWGVGNSGETN